ncbi:CRISPR-associated protein Cas4 [Cellulomonas palmilytica]|uniref:CRISPR-associated protein Cas4 n=1 Tax=Cellulomonas palmilytica TaxID=2608402 RepID=UPI001F2646A1|nr:PD-(D/E)XK nuclease family protein [Cellulomonas palmilytica]UJP40261.1 PD-(D/E)XK nuclease family protein [Cellulomonas palmilytica]
MAAWVQQGLWKRPGPHLERLYDDVCRAHGLEPESIRDGRLTRGRLGAREQQLRSLLLSAGPNPLVSCETPVRDDMRRLWGIPDLVARGTATLVIDLKTGTRATAPLPDRVRDQLLMYAHLVSVEDGKFPARAVVFSLIKGTIEISLGAADFDRLLAGIDAARASQPKARPSPDACRSCARRLTCGPHWDAVHLWDEPDGLEGEILRVAAAENGAVSVQLLTTGGPAWLTHLEPKMLGRDVAVGRHARAVRVVRRTSSPETWRATRQTQVAATTWRSD